MLCRLTCICLRAVLCLLLSDASSLPALTCVICTLCSLQLWTTAREVSGGGWTHCYSTKVKQDGTCKPGGSNHPCTHNEGYLVDGVLWDGTSDPSPWQACNSIGGWMSHRGYCTREFEEGRDGWSQPYTTANGCSAPHWQPRYGKRWRFGVYGDEAKCTFGCSDHELFEQGVDEASCVAKSTCTESCAFCTSHYREEGSDLSKAGVCIDRSPIFNLGAVPHSWTSDMEAARQQCSALGGSIFEFWERNLWMGCRLHDPIDQSTCLANNASNPHLSWHECEHYGNPRNALPLPLPSPLPPWAPYWYRLCGGCIPLSPSCPSLLSLVWADMDVDLAGHPRCKYHAWNHETQTGKTVYPPEIVAASDASLEHHELRSQANLLDPFTFRVMEELGCDWRSYARCRTDERICQLRNTQSLPNIEQYASSLGAIDCDRNDLGATSAECTANGGKCSDDDLGSFGWDSSTNTHKFGCVMPFERYLNSHGHPECYDGTGNVHWSKLGCVDKTIDYAQCIAGGGMWRRRAEDESECTQDGLQCWMHHWRVDTNKPPTANPITGELECGGCIPNLQKTPPRPVYQWSKAQYQPATFDRKLRWMTRGRVPLRRLTLRPDHHKLEGLIDALTARQLGREQASEFMREWIPKNALLATIACACEAPAFRYISPDGNELGFGDIEDGRDPADMVRLKNHSAGVRLQVHLAAECTDEGAGLDLIKETCVPLPEAMRAIVTANNDTHAPLFLGSATSPSGSQTPFLLCYGGSLQSCEAAVASGIATESETSESGCTELAATGACYARGGHFFRSSLLAAAGGGSESSSASRARRRVRRQLSQDKTTCFKNPAEALVRVAALRAWALVNRTWEIGSGDLVGDGGETLGFRRLAAAAGHGREQLPSRIGEVDTDALATPFEVVHAHMVTHDSSGTRRRVRRKLQQNGGASTLITAAAPQETAVSILFAGRELDLSVPLRGTAHFTATAVDAANSNAEVELKALPAAMMNAEVRRAGSCGASLSSGAGGYDVLTDACGTIIGQVVSDGLEVQTAATLQETVEMCITPRGDIEQKSTLYPVMDVAVDLGSGSLSPPLGTNLTYVAGDYCLSATTGVAYVLVRRTEAYSSDPDDCANAPPSAPPCPPSAPPPPSRGRACLQFAEEGTGCSDGFSRQVLERAFVPLRSTTKDGRPVYRALKSDGSNFESVYMYYDISCGSDAPAGWMLAEAFPALDADFDLDGKPEYCDGRMFMQGRGTSIPPESFEAWGYCERDSRRLTLAAVECPAGFEPFTSGPSNTPTVGFALVVSGDVSDYARADVRDSLKSAVAQAANVDAEQVTLVVQPASVKLIFVITVADVAAASSVQSVMATAMADTGAAQQLFASSGVTLTVEAIAVAPTITAAGQPSLIDVERGESFGGGGDEGPPIVLIAGIGGAVVALLFVLAFSLRYHYKAKGRARMVAKGSPAPARPLERVRV